MSKNFKRTQESFLKKGIHITKEGRGKNASYFINQDTGHAITLFEEKKNKLISSNDLRLNNLDFLVFIAIVVTEYQVYRGSFVSFCSYIKLKNNKVEDIKASLIRLQKNKLIHYYVDETDDNYFVAALLRKAEQNLLVDIKIINRCKVLGSKYNKRDWIPLLKLWLAIDYTYTYNLQPYTVDMLMDITNLNRYQIRECSKILQKENMFNKTAAYQVYENTIKRLGTNADPNAFIGQ